jgi:outer membrane beta-barrel protein
MRPAHRTRRPWALAALVPLVLALAASQVRAEDGDLDQGKVYAIQERAYRMNHEFALSFGFMPLDAFYKMFAVSGHYVVHFDDLWAWEAIHLSFSKYLSADTGLKDELNDKWDVQPTDPEENRIDFTLDTNLMLKPMVGKAVLFDDWVIHGESYFLLGVGAEKFETAWFPAVNVGLGLRIFVIDTISLRIEVREYVHFGEGVGSNLIFSLGFAYNAFAGDLNAKRSTGQEDRP